MFRRAVSSLLARKYSPRVIPRTAPGRSIHSSWKDDAIRRGAGVAAAALATASAGALALGYFRKGTDDDAESAARKKEEAMKARFEDWAKKYNRTYRDEEEKAMRFEAFKDNIKWIESQPPSTQKNLLPENCFADFKDEEMPHNQCCVDLDLFDDPNSPEYQLKKLCEQNANVHSFIWKPAVKQGDKQATQVSA